MKKKSMNTYAVSSRNYETFKMIACSLSSTDQNMPTYLNLAFIEIKNYFFPSWTLNSVCVHENVLFAIHAQMVSSIQKPFQYMYLYILSNTKLNSSWQNLHLKLLLLSMNWNNVTILDSFWWQILHSSGFLPSRTLVWNT